MKKDIFEYKKEVVAKLKFKSNKKEISLYNIQLLFNGKNYFENTVNVSELFSLLYPKTTYALIQPYTCGSICIPACANFLQEIEVFIEKDDVVFKTNKHIKDKYQHFGPFTFDKKAFFETLKQLKQEMDNDIVNHEIYDDLFLLSDYQTTNEECDLTFKYNLKEVQEININEYEFLFNIGKIYQKATEIKQNYYDLIQKNISMDINKKFDIFIKQKNGKFKKHDGYVEDIMIKENEKEDFKLKIEISEKGNLSIRSLFIAYCTYEEYFYPNLLNKKDYDEFNLLMEEIFVKNNLTDYLLRIKERKKEQYHHYEDENN